VNSPLRPQSLLQDDGVVIFRFSLIAAEAVALFNFRKARLWYSKSIVAFQIKI
jgi:hypothetical protein